MSGRAEQWQFTDAAGEYALPVTLPFDAHSALVAAGKLDDPYWAQNEYASRWVSDRDWLLTREITLNGASDLVLEGIDGVADVRINGQLVGACDNAFRTYRFDLSGIHDGTHRLELRFRALTTEAAARAAAQPYPVPYNQGNCPIPNGNMIRKPQCDFGWDWNIALAPFGVTGDVRVEPQGEARVEWFEIVQHHGTHVRLSLTLHLANVPDRQSVQFEIAGVQAEAKVADGVARAELMLDKPALWWPAGQGPQVLHELTARVGDLTTTRQIGLRDLQLISETDEAGRSFGFRVNGRDVFAKGANWIPADALHGRITREGVRDLLQSAVDANMNMIRVWGGGRYEPDWFYDLCDELGLMVWQDFMFACHLYQCDDAFLQNVAAEVTENSRRLQHHACIALWCGDNELIGALNWFEESRKDRDRYLVAYDRLNRTIETALKASVPDSNWWPSSPSPGPLSFGDAWHDDSAGDMHFWSVWHEGRDFDHYRDVKPRFCSEFGFQSYPSLSAIRSFADPADWNIAAPVMESHQKNAGGNARIAETMFRYFRFPVDFANFVYLSQVQQGLAIATAVTAWRALKPHCQGTLIWQLNDTWPCASWSSLDHGGNWKLLHHMAKRFFQPVLVTVLPVAGGYSLMGINDLGAPVDVTLTLSACSMSGELRALGDPINTTIGSEAVEITRLATDDLADDEVLALTWTHGDDRAGDIFAPKPWKAYDLRNPQIEMQVIQTPTAQEITLTAKSAAFYVALEADVPGRLSHAAFALFPGHPARITFMPQESGTQAQFTLRDLYSATYGAAA